MSSYVSCPHCGRDKIPIEPNEAHSIIECAKCGGKFRPMGEPQPVASAPPLSDLPPADPFAWAGVIALCLGTAAMLFLVVPLGWIYALPIGGAGIVLAIVGFSYQQTHKGPLVPALVVCLIATAIGGGFVIHSHIQSHKTQDEIDKMFKRVGPQMK